MEEKRVYDLEDRTLKFSKNLIFFLKKQEKGIINNEIIKQLTRSGTAIGANYIEANESLGKKDFLMRVRIARKEAKETKYWLELIENNETTDTIRQKLLKETDELLKILSAIIEKSKI